VGYLKLSLNFKEWCAINKISKMYVHEASKWRELVYHSMTVGAQKDAPARTGDSSEAREHVR
jgi:hypothetical protein